MEETVDGYPTKGLRVSIYEQKPKQRKTFAWDKNNRGLKIWGHLDTSTAIYKNFTHINVYKSISNELYNCK